MAAYIEPFGTTASGAYVHRSVLDNGPPRVALLSYGATVQAVVFDGRGVTVGWATTAG